MKKKRNIAVVIFSRANYARIKSLILNLKKDKKIKLQIIIGASAVLNKYGDIEKILKKDKIKPVAKIYSVVEGGSSLTMAKSTALGIIELTNIFSKIKPDLVLTVADRFETISTAIVSSYMNIPLAHTQGGEVTGSIDESVRHAITKLSHYHFPASKKSKTRLLKLGEEEKRIFLTGCPSIDLINRKKLNIDKSFIKDFQFVGSKIDFKKKYIVVLYHPNTLEYQKESARAQKIINIISKLSLQTVWLWPNIDAGSEKISERLRIFREKNKESKIAFVKNLEPENFIKLIYNCHCFVGNSSSAIREGSFLGIPSVNIGDRQEGREHGRNIKFVNYNENNIKNAIKNQMEKFRKIKGINIFGDGRAGKKIAKILATIELNINKKITY